MMVLGGRTSAMDRRISRGRDRRDISIVCSEIWARGWLEVYSLNGGRPNLYVDS
jgi:hypothetical protein